MSTKQEEKKEIRRVFSANGNVDPRKHFYVDPKPWNEKNLIPKLEQGGFYVLLAPSQTGKTTKCRTLLEMIKSRGTHLPILYELILLSFSSVDMQKVVGEVLEKDKRFFPTFLSHVEAYLGVSIKDVTSTSELFSENTKKKYFQNKDVILIIDEMDSIANIKEEERGAFLAQIRGIKQSWRNGKSLYCLYSTLIITNWSGDYLRDTIGNSPFNVSDTIYLDYFTETEFLDLWSQYEQQEGFIVEKQIKEYMYNISEGAPGILAMLGKYYDESKESIKNPLTYMEWVKRTNGFEFWKEIESYANFAKMVSTIEKEEDTKRLLLMFMAEGKFENFTQITSALNNLLKANVLKMKRGSISFASRFVQRFVDLKIRQVIPEPQELPLKSIGLSQGKEQFRVDVPNFVALVAQYMNRGVINGAQKKENKTSQSKSAPKGPKEIVYVNQFHDTLRLIFPSYVIK